MNSIKDFASLRPEVESPSVRHLDDLWSRATAQAGPSDRTPAGADAVIILDGPGEAERSPDRVDEARRRRFALLGAAASIVIGLVAVAAFTSGRTGEVPGVEQAPDSAQQAVSAPSIGAVPLPAVVEALGPVPLWGVDEPGWTLGFYSNFASEVPSDVPTKVFAGPLGAEGSWITVTPLVEQSATSATTTTIPPELDSSNTDYRVRVIESGGERVVVRSAGIDPVLADSVVDADSAGAELPGGFERLEDSVGAEFNRQFVYRFAGPEGQSIEIEVHGGGQPFYDAETSFLNALVTPGLQNGIDDRDGVDESTVVVSMVGATVEQERHVVARSGFWVTTIRTSEQGIGPGEPFVPTIGLIRILSEADWSAAVPDEAQGAEPAPSTTSFSSAATPPSAVDDPLEASFDDLDAVPQTTLQTTSVVNSETTDRILDIEVTFGDRVSDAAEFLGEPDTGQVSTLSHFDLGGGAVVDVRVFPVDGANEEGRPVDTVVPIASETITASDGSGRTAEVARLTDAAVGSRFRYTVIVDFEGTEAADGPWLVQVLGEPFVDQAAFLDAVGRVRIAPDQLTKPISVAI